MNIIGKTFVPLFLAAIMLASCNSSLSTPTLSQADRMETAISTVSTAFVATQRAMPTATATAVALSTVHLNATTPGTSIPLPTFSFRTTPRLPASPFPTPTPVPSSTPLVFTDPSIPLSERIVCYYLVGQREHPIPEGAVRAAGLLAPTYADETYTSDTAADLRTALEIVLHDERNRSMGPVFEPEIVDVTFRFGHAKVLLQGEYSIGPPSSSFDVYGPFVRSRMLILLTVFANPSVQTAAVSLNDDTIANLAISDPGQAKPANYVFTRAEIETYTIEQAYVTPSPIPPTPTPGPTSTPFVSIDPSRPLPELSPNAIDLQWITAYGLPGNQIVTKLHPTRDGGFILVGNTILDQPYGAWLFKLRTDGLIVWQRSLPQVTALDVLETSAGDFILAGDLHWIKLDSQGDILWQYTFERPSYHTGPILRLVEESNGNIVVEAIGSRAVFDADAKLQSFTDYAMHWDSQTYPGNIRDRSGRTLWAGGGAGGVGGPMSYQYWVGKANLNNGWLNVFTWVNNPFEPMLFIQTTADGGAIVGNPIRSYLTDGGSDLLISRLSGDGAVRWQKVYPAAYVLDFHAFETQSGDFIVAGTLGYSTDRLREDVWILRLDREGNIRWVKLYGTEGRDAVAVIHELSNGDLIFAGQSNGIGTGNQDMWVLKTNAQGEIPNCGLALDMPGPSGNPAVFSSGVNTIALEEISVIARETRPSFEDEQSPFGDAAARTYSLCSPSP